MRYETNMNNKFKSNLGFSLIELLVAMVIGLIILLGLVSLFTSSSSLNRAQTGLAVLQENGRYAITRIKSDIESAGRKHCSTMALPNEVVTDWNQGYLMNSWTVDSGVSFDNGWPTPNDVRLDAIADDDQLGDVNFPSTGLQNYPLDPANFIRGHECTGGSCLPLTTIVGADGSANVPAAGTTAGSRARETDILTVRYLTGGIQVNAIAPPVVTLDVAPDFAVTNDIAILGDCDTTYVANATWNGTQVNMGNASSFPSMSSVSDTKVYSYSNDLRTVTYHIELANDPSVPGRLISNLMRTQNGTTQLLVEGVERFDVFYLTQLQTGHVARYTADQVQNLQGGAVAGIVSDSGIPGCTQVPRVNSDIKALNLNLANDQGCAWRSIYAIEVHLLLNTVNNSSQLPNDLYIYSLDSLNEQNPASGLVSQLPGERMYRREFSAVIPIKSYTL